MTQIFPNENFSTLNFLIQSDPLMKQQHQQMQTLKKKNNKKAINSKQQKQINQLVRAGDWICLICNNLNFSFRNECNRCQVQTKKQNYMQNLLLISSEQQKNNLPFPQSLNQHPMLPQQLQMPLYRKPLDDLTTTINNNSMQNHINIPLNNFNSFNNNNQCYFNQQQNQNQQSQQQAQQQQSNSQQSIIQTNSQFNVNQQNLVTETNSSFKLNSSSNETIEIQTKDQQNNQHQFQLSKQQQSQQQENHNNIQISQQTQALPIKKFSKEVCSNYTKEGFENVLLLTPPKHKYNHYFVSPSSDIQSSSSQQNHYQTYKSPQRLLPSMSPLMKILTKQSSSNTTAEDLHINHFKDNSYKNNKQRILNTCFETQEECCFNELESSENLMQFNNEKMNLSRLLGNSSADESNNQHFYYDSEKEEVDYQSQSSQSNNSSNNSSCNSNKSCENISNQLKKIDLTTNEKIKNNNIENNNNQNFKYFQNKLKNLSNNKNFFEKEYSSRLGGHFINNMNANSNENYEESILNLLNEDKENINYTNFNNILSLNNNNQQQKQEKINLSVEKSTSQQNKNKEINIENHINFSQKLTQI